jgi:hypothetical protein
MAMAKDNSGGRQRWWMTTARKIGQQTTRGKKESGRQTTTAIDKRLISPPGREQERIKELIYAKRLFFSNAIGSVWLDFLLPQKQPMCPLYLLRMGWRIFSLLS